MPNIFVYNPRMNFKNILTGSAGYVISVSFALYMVNIYLAIYTKASALLIDLFYFIAFLRVIKVYHLAL